MGFEGILNQIFQPYFYYSAISLVLAFVCVKILTSTCGFIGQKAKSLLYIVPLALPLAVMIVFIPQTSISYLQIKTLDALSAARLSGFPVLSQMPSQISYYASVSVLSVTGILCLVGLAAGSIFALSMVLADDRIARRVLHVISLSPEEYPWLQAEIAQAASKLGVSMPKVGVVEDLRPNAFTIGYGKRATLVFSIGLFKVLNREEVTAVAAHELAHVKNNDFFFKTLSNALTTVSFFNPLSYLTSTNAQREREMYADEIAITLLKSPSTLGDALAKICRSIQAFPRESVLANFSSNLLVSSSFLHRVGILATHPRLDTRLKRISTPKVSGIRLSRRNRQVAVLLSVMLILSAAAVTLAMADLQANFTADLTSTHGMVASSAFMPTISHFNPASNVVFNPNSPASQLNSSVTPALFYPSAYSGNFTDNTATGNNSYWQPQPHQTEVYYVYPQNNTVSEPLLVVQPHTCFG